MGVEKPLNATGGLPRTRVALIARGDRAPKQRIPDSERLVVSWFGWDIAHHELISAEAFQRWLRRLYALCQERGWMIERMGSAMDMILGCPSRSVTRREFFRFQRDWDALNQEFGFRFSGALWLMTAARNHDGDLPFETYEAGSKRRGDSIGRPSRHAQENLKPKASTKEPEPIRSVAEKPRVRKEGR